jgi:hypothetical protein
LSAGDFLNRVARPKTAHKTGLRGTLAPRDSINSEGVSGGCHLDVAHNVLYGNYPLQTLTDSGSYTVTTPVNDPYTRHLYLFPYDWRLDNVETARKLFALIDQLRVNYGRPDLKVDIVAHSVGGIVSCYMLEFGTEDVLDRDDAPIAMAGASKINRLILLGTQSLGSTNTIENMIEGSKLGMKRIMPVIIATLPAPTSCCPTRISSP